MVARAAAAAALGVALAGAAAAHGMVTAPRLRGGLVSSRGLSPRVVDPAAEQDYCNHCLNAGGTGRLAGYGGWNLYEPLTGRARRGAGLCGDPVGNNDHLKSGKFANPPSTPFSAEYVAGGVANFEFDATTNHGGYLEFYLCDVENNPGQDINYNTFARDCEYLERVPHADCESGNDRECGPIDPDHRGRWVLPCRIGAGDDQGDQILGGANGKMAYRLPNRVINVGVIHSYWATANTCPTDRFMMDYKYPQAWAGCPGDGGSLGGRPQHKQTCGESGRFPEEFWGCSDVRVKPSNGIPQPRSPPAFDQNPEPANNPQEPVASTGGDFSPAPKPLANAGGGGSGPVSEDGNCDRNGEPCTVGGRRCCASSFVCGLRSGSSTTRCINPNQVVSASEPAPVPAAAPAPTQDNDCAADGDFCAGKRCCSSDAQCRRVQGDGKVGEVCDRGHSGHRAYRGGGGWYRKY